MGDQPLIVSLSALQHYLFGRVIDCQPRNGAGCV